MTSEEQLLATDLTKVAREGSLIYEEIRSAYESHHGEFLAIEIESKDAYLAGTSAEAVVAARKAHPGKVFYVVKIGFDAVETMSNLFSKE